LLHLQALLNGGTLHRPSLLYSSQQLHHDPSIFCILNTIAGVCGWYRCSVPLGLAFPHRGHCCDVPLVCAEDNSIIGMPSHDALYRIWRFITANDQLFSLAL
jgi:hypothetical protein